MNFHKFFDIINGTSLLNPEQQQPDTAAMMMQFLLPMGLMVAAFYFVLIRPESKRKKKTAQMLDNIQIADEVVTSGGIIGRVIDVKPNSNTIVIETGGDKTRIRVLKAYIIENRTVHDE